MKVTNVSAVTRRDLRRVLLTQSVSVEYSITVLAGATAADLTTTLLTSQASGRLDMVLSGKGIAGAVTSPALITNLSPTASPTVNPFRIGEIPSIPVDIGAIVGGVIGGFFGLLIGVGLILYLVLKRSRRIYTINNTYDDAFP